MQNHDHKLSLSSLVYVGSFFRIPILLFEINIFLIFTSSYSSIIVVYILNMYITFPPQK